MSLVSRSEEGDGTKAETDCPRSSGVSKILVIEDDPAVRDIVERALSREGFDTLAVGDGEAALERLGNADSFDLLILDVMLPGMDGISLCRELRAGDGANREVRVIMLTARDDETSVVVGLEVGADDYITKPFSAQELVSRVRAQLRRRTPHPKAGPEGRKSSNFLALSSTCPGGRSLSRELRSNSRPRSSTCWRSWPRILAGSTAASRSCATSGTGTSVANCAPPTSTWVTFAGR